MRIPRTLVSMAALVAAAWTAARAQDAYPRMSKVADGVFFFEQIDPTKQGVTVDNLVVVTNEGVLVADGQGTVDNTRALLADIAKVTAQPVRWVVVGSDHGDHRGGDSAFPSTATFVAHPYSKANLERQAAAPSRRAGAPPTIVPTETVADARTMTPGGRTIEIRFLGRAHAGGDLAVYLPKEKILYTSEIFSTRIFPSLANGYPSEWIEALKRAEQMDIDRYLPAHQAMALPKRHTREEVRLFRGALERVVSEGRRLRGANASLDSAPESANWGEFGAWWRTTENAPGAIKRVYMELDGQLTR